MAGLGKIVVGTDFQADDALHVLTARRQHDGRNGFFLAQAAQHLEAVQARHHHVRRHGLEFFRKRVRQRRLAIAGDGEAAAAHA